MRSTSAEDISIQAVSPLSIFSAAGAAVAGAGDTPGTAGVCARTTLDATIRTQSTVSSRTTRLTLIDPTITSRA